MNDIRSVSVVDPHCYLSAYLHIDGAVSLHAKAMSIGSSTRSVFFSFDATAQQRLDEFSPNFHQQTSCGVFH